MLSIIEGAPGISRTGIRDALQRHVSSNDVEAALQELLVRRPAVVEQVTEKGTGGRPRTTYRAVIAQRAESAVSA